MPVLRGGARRAAAHLREEASGGRSGRGELAQGRHHAAPACDARIRDEGLRAFARDRRERLSAAARARLQRRGHLGHCRDHRFLRPFEPHGQLQRHAAEPGVLSDGPAAAREEVGNLSRLRLLKDGDVRILLVEDDVAQASAVCSYLTAKAFVVDVAPGLAEARAALTAVQYAAVLLDLHLGDGDGLSLLPSVRALRDRPIVIVLTARDQVTDRIRGLDAGADDYLIKPYDPAE